MGWSSALYVLQADKYYKILRPLLRDNYGTLNTQFLLNAELKLIEYSDFLHAHPKDQKFFKNLNCDQHGRSPLQRYFRTHRTTELYGNSESLSQEIQDTLSKVGTPVYDDGWPSGHGNQLMRIDSGLEYVDAFNAQWQHVKICNMQHVQNYIRYLELIEEAYKDVKSCASIYYYSYAAPTKTIFNDILTLIEKEGKIRATSLLQNKLII